MPISILRRLGCLLRRRRKAALALAGAGLLSVAALSWALRPGTPSQAYLTAKVAVGDLEQTILASGILKPIRQVEVGAQVSGQLRQLSVKLGQRVKRGQRLAEIDPALAEGKLRMVQADLERNLAERRGKRALLDGAEQEFERQQVLLAAEATSRKDWQDAGHRRSQLRAEVAALDAQIVKDRYQIELAQVELGYTRIGAPMDGEVLSLDTREGQTVIASQQAPKILSLGDLSKMEVQAQVSEADIVHVHPGQKAYFTLLGDPEQRYFGVVREIRPTPEKINNAMFYTVLFDAANPQRLLRVDMTVQVGLIRAEAKQALLVPLTALEEPQDDGRYRVRVVAEGQAPEPRLVRIGLRGRTEAQVLAGLRAGEEVVIGDATDAGKED